MKKRIVILVVSLIAITGIIVGVSYAFFSIGGSQEQANTFTSGCLNISLTNESTSINLTNTYPITDIEGLEGASYDFTIKNTCTTETNYSINLESLNKQTNSLSADYIKVALSSDTVDHVISKLSSNTSVTPEIDGSYESYNLYTGTLKGSESKTYHLKLWIDYDATKEGAANKTYSSKINVIANPETTVVDILEAKFGIEGTTVTSTLTEGLTSASYCITTDNICEPNTSATVSNNSYTVEVESKEENQMVCTKLNNTSKIICSNVIEGVKLCPEGAEACNTILANNSVNSGTPNFSQVATTNEGVYKTQDDWGDSYYFRGAVTNNWVKFAGYYWRIIRINGDGSIRLIYNGTSTATTGTSTQIQTSAFNSSYNDNAYVGYMYGSTGASSYAATHANNNNSTIKGVLDSWYQTNIANKGFGNKVSTEAGFCGDREPSTSSSSSNGSGGTGITTTYYGGYIRLVNSTKSPTLKCKNSSDLYTVSGSSKGNKALSNPVGLITADEVAMAGGVYRQTNQSYYLYTNQVYWTMSPSFFNGSYARVFYVNSSGYLNLAFVNNSWGVCPVINLSADVKVTGSGTSSDPFVVS
ncbi:unknown [Mycoplasma sp. CAG:776]|nr:unknown [Mycoplasma sp. CAG:776]